MDAKSGFVADGEQRGGQTSELWFVYIVECCDRTFYTGIAKDLDRRLDQHNAGKGARYTRGRRPVSLRYHEIQSSQSCALIRECQIKALSRAEKQHLIDQAARPREG